MEEDHQGGGLSETQRGGLKLERSSVFCRERSLRGTVEGRAS